MDKRKLKHEIQIARGALYTLRMTTNYDDLPKGAPEKIREAESALERALKLVTERS